MKLGIFKKFSVSVAAIALSLGSLSIASTPAYAGADCSISSWSEVDGSSGSIMFYPSFLCYSQKLSASMQTFPSNGGNTWGYPSPGQWYAGNGVVVPIQGAGEYCAYFQLSASTGSGVEEYYGRGCTII